MANAITNRAEFNATIRALHSAGMLDRSHIADLQSRVTEPKITDALGALLADADLGGAAFERAAFQRLTRLQSAPGAAAALVKPDADGVTRLRASRKVWTADTEYLMAAKYRGLVPMFGSKLWAQNGPLHQMDLLLAARGQPTGALDFERQSVLNSAVGKTPGYYLPSSHAVESDALRTSGVDFVAPLIRSDDPNADLPTDPDLKLAVDFLQDGSLVSPQGDYTSWKAVTLEGHQFLTVTTERVTLDGKPYRRPVFTNAEGERVATSDVIVVLTNSQGQISGDGKAEDTLNAAWWGSCDKLVVAGMLFEDPKQDVTIDGVTFTRENIRGLLTVIADSQTRWSESTGARYQGRLDQVMTVDPNTGSAEIYLGKIENLTTRDLLAGEFERINNTIVVNRIDRVITLRRPDGTKIVLAPETVQDLRMEDPRDMDPAAFHALLRRRLGAGEPIALDVDSGKAVHNEVFDGANLTETKKKPWAVTPHNLVGHQGRYRGGELSVVTAEILRVDDVERTYHYWLERNDADEIVNSGWVGKWFSEWFVDNPDFAWHAVGKPTFEGDNPRNPFVLPAIVGEIYRRSIEDA